MGCKRIEPSSANSIENLSPAGGSRQFPAEIKYDQREMPGNAVNEQWSQCVLYEHTPLHELLVNELNLTQTLGVFNHLTYADLNEVVELTVAHPHHPCFYVGNGVQPDFITTVENALRICQVEKNSCVEKLNSAIQYFYNIGREDILQLQIIYSL